MAVYGIEEISDARGLAVGRTEIEDRSWRTEIVLVPRNGSVTLLDQRRLQQIDHRYRAEQLDLIQLLVQFSQHLWLVLFKHRVEVLVRHRSCFELHLALSLHVVHICTEQQR